MRIKFLSSALKTGLIQWWPINFKAKNSAAQI
jgi:hypothetical protein